MKHAVVVVAVLSLLAGSAVAQWSDNFDTYTVGTINGQGGWHGWGATPAAAGNVTNSLSLSPMNSQEIATGHDSVREYAGYTSGKWTYSAMQYIKSPLEGGKTFFILLNTYNDPAGPYNWSIQTEFDPATGLAKDTYTTQTTPYVVDQWVPIRVEIDLDNDLREFFYNNISLGTNPWKTGTASVANIAAVDLYSEHTSSVYYDDMSLVPEPATGLLLVLAAGTLLRRRS